jgi:probable rRNA maturation factor
MPITFQAADVKLPSLKKTALKKFLSVQTKKKLHVGYVFCSDEFLLSMNRQFLGHDFYTDIITFPLSETDKEIEAEIYISVDRVKDNAAQLKVDFSEELNRVIFHGVLHLMGYKDKIKADKETMRGKENEWLHGFKRSLSGA